MSISVGWSFKSKQTHITKQHGVPASCNQHWESNQWLIRCNAPGIDLPRQQEATLRALNETHSITGVKVKHRLFQRVNCLGKQEWHAGDEITACDSWLSQCLPTFSKLLLIHPSALAGSFSFLCPNGFFSPKCLLACWHRNLTPAIIWQDIPH